MKQLTISIAGYNVERFIRQTLDSLLCEHIDQIEVFVVDDETGQEVEHFDLTKVITPNEVLNVHDLTVTSGLEMHALAFKTALLQANNVEVTEKCFYTDNEYRTKGFAFAETILITDFMLYRYRVGREGQSVDISGMRKHYPDTIKVAKAMIAFHKSHRQQFYAYTNLCLKNAVDFVYQTLVIIGRKTELLSFDQYVKTQGDTYYEGRRPHVRLLQRLHFHAFGCISAYVRIRYTLAPKVKRLIRSKHR